MWTLPFYYRQRNGPNKIRAIKHGKSNLILSTHTPELYDIIYTAVLETYKLITGIRNLRE